MEEKIKNVVKDCFDKYYENFRIFYCRNCRFNNICKKLKERIKKRIN